MDEDYPLAKGARLGVPVFELLHGDDELRLPWTDWPGSITIVAVFHCCGFAAFGAGSGWYTAYNPEINGFTENIQLLKCFEIASTLADTILLTSATSYSAREFGPQDFLHALYQKLLPSLEQDSLLKSNLRSKMAEALVTAPARLLMEPTSMEPEDSRHYTAADGIDFTV